MCLVDCCKHPISPTPGSIFVSAEIFLAEIAGFFSGEVLVSPCRVAHARPFSQRLTRRVRTGPVALLLCRQLRTRDACLCRVLCRLQSHLLFLVAQTQRNPPVSAYPPSSSPISSSRVSTERRHLCSPRQCTKNRRYRQPTVTVACQARVLVLYRNTGKMKYTLFIRNGTRTLHTTTTYSRKYSLPSGKPWPS